MGKLYGHADKEQFLREFKVQYPDLTEIQSSYQLKHVSSEKELAEFATTEFVFATTVQHSWTMSAPEDLQRLGFTRIATMNNWYPTHAGEVRAITLWWKHINPGAPPAAKLSRYRWGVNYNYHYPFVSDMSASGCGFKVVEPPLTSIRARFFKYFSLIRMPLEVGAIRQRLLTEINYRRFAVGTTAAYWVNGFDPATYDYKKVEVPFFDRADREERARMKKLPEIEPDPEPQLATNSGEWATVTYSTPNATYGVYYAQGGRL